MKGPNTSHFRWTRDKKNRGGGAVENSCPHLIAYWLNWLLPNHSDLIHNAELQSVTSSFHINIITILIDYIYIKTTKHWLCIPKFDTYACSMRVHLCNETNGVVRLNAKSNVLQPPKVDLIFVKWGYFGWRMMWPGILPLF